MKDGEDVTYHDGTPEDICKKLDRIIKDKKYTFKALLPNYFKKLLITKILNFLN